MDLFFTVMLRIKTDRCGEINESKKKGKALVCSFWSLLSNLHPQKEPVLVSNFAFDLVRNSNPKPSLPALHCLLSFEFNLCFEFVMFRILDF